MMKTLFLLVLPLGLAACATSNVENAAPAAPRGLSPQEIVAARQAAFGLSASAFGGMKGVVDSGGEVKPLGFAARNIARWAHTLPTMFPEGTALPTSHALPAIWTNRADFDAKAAAYAAAADRMVAASQASDKAAFAGAWKATGAACKGCHDLYRADERH